MVTAQLQGVLLQLVTPFFDGGVDLDTVQSLVAHYSGCGVGGFVLLGTTGESPTVTAVDQRQVVAAAIAPAGSVPVYVGVSGNSTSEVVATIRWWECLAVAGYLVVTPYYNPTEPRRSRRALLCCRRRDASAAHRLQRSLPNRHQPVQPRTLRDPRSGVKRGRRQGLRRPHRPESEPAAARPDGAARFHRRGPPVPQQLGQRRGRAASLHPHTWPQRSSSRWERP